MDKINNWKKNIILFLDKSEHIAVRLNVGSVCYYLVYYIKNSIGRNDDNIDNMRFFAYVFLSPFAGVWADRYNRKLLIILSDSLIACATLVLAILFFFGFDSVWMLFVASAIRATGSGIQTV